MQISDTEAKIKTIIEELFFNKDKNPQSFN